LHKALKELYESLTKALDNDPPLDVRINLWHLARETLRLWIGKEYFEVKVQKFIGKISNGFEYWFTFVINPGVEPVFAGPNLTPHADPILIPYLS